MLQRTTRSRMSIGLGILCALVTSQAPAAAQQGVARDAVPPSAQAVLRAAFTNRYEVDITANILLVMRDGGGRERRREVKAASKMIDDRMHSVGRIESPEYLRGMTILTIEAGERDHDAFVFLPAMGRVRRISSAQREDAFFGSDVTYEDLERRRVEEYELESIEAATLEGEAVYHVRGSPRVRLSYATVLFVIARSDRALIEVQYFKRDQDAPYRVITSPRAHMVERDGHVLPTRMLVRNELRGTTTEVVFDDLQVNPPIDDTIFSATALERQQELPGTP